MTTLVWFAAPDAFAAAVLLNCNGLPVGSNKRDQISNQKNQTNRIKSNYLEPNHVCRCWRWASHPNPISIKLKLENESRNFLCANLIERCNITTNNNKRQIKTKTKLIALHWWWWWNWYGKVRTMGTVTVNRRDSQNAGSLPSTPTGTTFVVFVLFFRN